MILAETTKAESAAGSPERDVALICQPFVVADYSPNIAHHFRGETVASDVMLSL